MSAPETPKLLVRLREFTFPGADAAAPGADLLGFAAAENPLFWQSPAATGPRFVARGEAARLRFNGADRFAEASKAWRELVAAARLSPDSVLLPGLSAKATLESALTAFGSFAFSSCSQAESVLLVPRFLLRTDGLRAEGMRAVGLHAHGLLTEVWPADAAAPAPDEFAALFSPPATVPATVPATHNATVPATDNATVPATDNATENAAGAPSAQPGFGELAQASTPDAQAFTRAVADGLAQIGAGAAEKIVLARRVTGSLPAAADLRIPLARLRQGYGAGSAVFAVAGLMGASPEPLVRFADGQLTSRVLAGTRKLGKQHGDPAQLETLTAELLADPKELREHVFARDSAVAALAGCTSELRVNDTPRVLTLPNVVHLMSEITAQAAAGLSSLDLVAALHPTAAVAGTPTEAALRLLRKIEGFDRERFAGPTGWVNGAGDGEWAIALRCAQVGAADAAGQRPLTAWAGCGIVEGAVPAHELRETTAKLRPVRDAFGAAL